MIVTRAEVDAFLGVDEEPDTPKVVGRCVITPPDKRGPCATIIFSDDILAVELDKPKQFCCGDCWDKLFRPKPESDPEKNSKKRGPKKAGDHYRSPRPPQVHKGEDLSK